MPDATKELIIRIKGDSSPLKSAAKQAAAELLKVDREAKRLADNQAKEAKRAADALAKEAKRTADAQAREAKRVADAQAREAKRAADAQAKEAKKAFNASFVSFQAVQSAAIEFTAKQGELAKRRRLKEEQELRKIEEAEKKRIKRSLTDEEVALLARNKAVQISNQKRIDAAHEAMSTEKKGFDLASMAGGQFRDVVGSIAGQFTLLNIGQAVLDRIGESFSRARRSAEEAGKFVTEYREALLEIAALKGRLGQTTAETKEQLLFRSQTLQTADQARNFQESMIGSGASSVGTRISQPEFDKLMVMSGSMQPVLGADPDAIGSLTGMMPMLMGGNNQKATDVLRKQNQVFKLLDLGGSKLSPAVNQYMKNAPLLTSGVINDPAKLAALQSAFSLSNPGSEAETTMQFTRATVGSLGRMRGQGVEVNEKQAEYLKRIGATDQMDPIEIGKMISRDIAKQEADAASKGRKFEPIGYFRSKGYANQEDIMALMNFHGLNKSVDGQPSQFSKFEEGVAKVPDINETMAATRGWQAADPVAQQRKAELAGELSKTAVGAGPMEYYNSLRKAAFERLKARGEITGSFDERKDDFYARGSIQKEAASMLRSEGARKGLFFPGNLVQEGSMNPFESDQDRAKKFYDIGQKIGAAGGEMIPGMGDLVDLARRQLKIAEDAENRVRNGALPAAPPPGMRR